VVVLKAADRSCDASAPFIGRRCPDVVEIVIGKTPATVAMPQFALPLQNAEKVWADLCEMTRANSIAPHRRQLAGALLQIDE
jgi:hypothetical protein